MHTRLDSEKPVPGSSYHMTYETPIDTEASPPTQHNYHAQTWVERLYRATCALHVP